MADYEEHDTLWDRDFYDYLREEGEREAAGRYIETWDRLEALGVVRHPEDSDITLTELERIARMLG